MEGRGAANGEVYRGAGIFYLGSGEKCCQLKGQEEEYGFSFSRDKSVLHNE
jgi:hypothetical protein